jgi:hypothetical protein
MWAFWIKTMKHENVDNKIGNSQKQKEVTILGSKSPLTLASTVDNGCYKALEMWIFRHPQFWFADISVCSHVW